MFPLTISEILVRVIAGAAAIAFLILCLNWAKHLGRRVAGKHSKSPKTMDVILVIVGAALLIFTVVMIVIYVRTGMEPSTLETCVFAALGGECGVMGWIKTTKDKLREREWQQEDAKPPDKPPVDDFPTNDL